MEDEYSQTRSSEYHTSDDTELTDARMQKLLFLSFRFSQGSRDLQLAIFEFLHAMHPHWRIDLEMARRVLVATVPAIQRYINPESSQISAFHHVQKDTLDQIGIENQTRGAINMMRSSLDDADDRSSRAVEEIVAAVTGRLVERDAYYMANGRPGSSSTAEAETARKDSHLSYLCRYSLRRRSTGDSDYDELFDRIHTYVSTTAPAEFERSTGVPYSLLRWVVRSYNSYHPDALARLPRSPHSGGQP